jgi:hypothetical protein
MKRRMRAVAAAQKFEIAGLTVIGIGYILSCSLSQHV